MERISRGLNTVSKTTYIVLILSFISFGYGNGQNQYAITDNDFRLLWFNAYRNTTLGVVESQNMRNDHPIIYKMNKALGIPKNASYCSSSSIYAAYILGVKFKGVNGFAYSWRQPSKLIFYPQMLRGNLRKIPKIPVMAAVICNWSHVEFVGIGENLEAKYDLFLLEGRKKGAIVTIGCNTTGNNRNRREGCYYPIERYWSQVSAIYDHVPTRTEIQRQ